jgi:hypothetical protein
VDGRHVLYGACGKHYIHLNYEDIGPSGVEVVVVVVVVVVTDSRFNRGTSGVQHLKYDMVRMLMFHTKYFGTSWDQSLRHARMKSPQPRTQVIYVVRKLGQCGSRCG